MRAPLAVPVAILGALTTLAGLVGAVGAMVAGARYSPTAVHVRYYPAPPPSPSPYPTPKAIGKGQISSQQVTVYSSNDVPLQRLLHALAVAMPLLLVAGIGLLLLIGAVRARRGRDLHGFLAWSLLGVGLATALTALVVPLLEQEATLAAIRGLDLRQTYRGHGAPPRATTDTVADLGYTPQWLVWLLGHALMVAGAAVAWTGAGARRLAARVPQVRAGA